MAWLTEKTHFLFRITRILMNLDGPSWREKLSPIPAVPTSAHLRAWQLAVEPPPNQVGDSCSRPQPGITGGGSLHCFLLKVILSCVYIFIGRQGMNSSIRPGFKLRTLFSLFLTSFKKLLHTPSVLACMKGGRWITNCLMELFSVIMERCKQNNRGVVSIIIHKKKK